MVTFYHGWVEHECKKLFVTLSFAALLIVIIACKLFVPEDMNQDNSATPQVMDGEKLPTPVVTSFSEEIQDMQTTPSTSIQATIKINAVETGVRIVAISANSNRNLAVDDQGRVWEWGTYQEASCNSPCLGEPDCKLRPS